MGTSHGVGLTMASAMPILVSFCSLHVDIFYWSVHCPFPSNVDPGWYLAIRVYKDHVLNIQPWLIAEMKGDMRSVATVPEKASP